ncbi:hypothetical protein ID866_12496 [Astraeus odoratus]|nr:hypothetical protein ID866_12496 [Astraeus odoratus]
MSANSSTSELSTLEAEVIGPNLTALMIGHTFTALLIPLFIALFYFSNKHSRRTPIFMLNIVVIVLAFSVGVTVDALAVHSILSPLVPWPLSINIAIGLLGIFQTILVDLILLLRLISVYPVHHLGVPRFALLIAIPVLLKIARLVNVVIFTKELADAMHGPNAAQNMAHLWLTTPCLKIDWTSQVIDNTYASAAFLWRIRKQLASRQGVTSDEYSPRTTFAGRLRALSRIALSNFVIPALFSIVQLIVVYRNVSAAVVNHIVYVNTMLTVFGVVFATVWVGKERRRDEEIQNERAMKIDARQMKRDGSNSPSPLETWKAAPGVSASTTTDPYA